MRSGSIEQIGVQLKERTQQPALACAATGVYIDVSVGDPHEAEQHDDSTDHGANGRDGATLAWHTRVVDGRLPASRRATRGGNDTCASRKPIARHHRV